MITIACGPDPHSLRYAEAVVSTLTEAGFDSRTASWAYWTIFYLILGIAQEQQVARDAPAVITAEQVPAHHIRRCGLILDSLRTRLAALMGKN
jgi:TetR/AcrR family tetracycline transcriptional repressor